MIINELSRGIPHIEDLPVSDFIKTLNSLHEYEITEKLDGAQILFGIDNHGFYTSRESKGGQRIYNESDYPLDFASVYKRSTHKLLEMVVPELKRAGMRPGDQVEAEVLFGELPNVVPYSADVNYLVLLRTTEGAVSIDKLKSALNEKTISISLLTPFTKDGRTIETGVEENVWKFSRSPVISANVPTLQRSMSKHIMEMVSYLKSNSGINDLANVVVEGLPLNRRPDWCEPSDWKDVKELIREKRDEISMILSELHIPKIKKLLLTALVSNQASRFGPVLESGGWIEGVVLKHNATGRMVKIVDKDVFGITRESAWEVRNSLTEKAKGVNSVTGLSGSMLLEMATALGHAELGTIQAKSYLRKMGSITEDRVLTLSTGINHESIRDYWLNLLDQKESLLEYRLAEYEQSQRANYSTGINKRTMEVFASIFEQISMLRQSTKSITCAGDLIHILVGKQLAEI
jgi:hypothetical protein